MNEMTWMALLLGAFGGFIIGATVASPRMWYRGDMAVQGDISEWRAYLQDFVLGIVGAVIGVIIAALAFL
jgi:hypothetical protein